LTKRVRIGRKKEITENPQPASFVIHIKWGRKVGYRSRRERGRSKKNERITIRKGTGTGQRGCQYAYAEKLRRRRGVHAKEEMVNKEKR